MKTLEFTKEIAADKKKVWQRMLDPETYKEWTNVSWPGSYYEGKWAKGEKVKFLSPGQGGTVATMVDVNPHDRIFARHTAVLNADGSEDTTSDAAKGWIGTEEGYAFSESNGNTKVTVRIKTTPEWEKMFTDGWPAALDKLKEVAEK